MFIPMSKVINSKKDKMKFIKYFVLTITIISFFGCLVLLNEGSFDFYAFLNMTTLGLASYGLFKK